MFSLLVSFGIVLVFVIDKCAGAAVTDADLWGGLLEAGFFMGNMGLLE